METTNDSIAVEITRYDKGGEQTIRLSFPKSEITDKITNTTVKFAEEFGTYLGKDEVTKKVNKEGKIYFEPIIAHLTTSQLRRFFGEVKRLQMSSYNETALVLLKPKLAYAVARANANSEKKIPNKIEYLYKIIVDVIDTVLESPNQESTFKNFILFFEAIVAYHKKAEETK